MAVLNVSIYERGRTAFHVHCSFHLILLSRRDTQRFFYLSKCKVGFDLALVEIEGISPVINRFKLL
jgi:hypothetical protein